MTVVIPQEAGARSLQAASRRPSLSQEHARPLHRLTALFRVKHSWQPPHSPKWPPVTGNGVFRRRARREDPQPCPLIVSEAETLFRVVPIPGASGWSSIGGAAFLPSFLKNGNPWGTARSVSVTAGLRCRAARYERASRQTRLIVLLLCLDLGGVASRGQRLALVHPDVTQAGALGYGVPGPGAGTRPAPPNPD